MAARAGVDPDYVDRLVELGILSPGSGNTFSAGDVRRARWVQSFERAGVPLEGLAAAVRDGALSFSYLDATAFDRFAGVSTTTFRELSERTGVPLDLLLVVREAHGFAEPRTRGSRPRGRAGGRAGDRAPALLRDPAGGDRAIAPSVRGRPPQDRRDRNGLVPDRGPDAAPRGRDDGGRDAGGPGRHRVPDGPPHGAGAAVHLPRTAGTRLEHERGGGRGGRAGTGRSVPSGSPPAGRVLPRHHRVHAADRGAGRRGRRRPGDEAGDPGPRVLAGARWAAGQVAGRRRDVLLPEPGRRRARPRSTWWRGCRRQDCRRPTSGSTPGRSSSRMATTSAGPSTSRRGSPSTPDPARCW